MSLKSLFLETFTWWNNQTLSTKLLTLFRGKFVGKDINGNIFYINKKIVFFIKEDDESLKKKEVVNYFE